MSRRRARAGFQYYIAGRCVGLRGLERADITQRYLNWLNDRIVNQYLYVGQRPSTLESLRAYYDSARADANTTLFAIDAAGGPFIGTAKLTVTDPVARVVEFGLLIGDRAFWNKGCATEATRLAVEWAFEKLNAHKVTLGVIAGNLAAIKVYARVGFVEEGRLRKQAFYGGRYCDVVLMGLLAGQWRKART